MIVRRGERRDLKFMALSIGRIGSEFYSGALALDWRQRLSTLTENHHSGRDPTKSANPLHALVIGSNKPKPSANIVTQIAMLKINAGVMSRLHLLHMRSTRPHQNSSPKPEDAR